MQKFYDPIDDVMKEPRLPGISFSFSADGYFEEASYIVISNRTHTPIPHLHPLQGGLN